MLSLASERCARCRRVPSSLDIARAAGDYEGTLRAIIRAFKYDGRRTLARPLAALMVAAGSDALNGADFVAPVPLHTWRSLRRGFNQAADLAHGLGRPVRDVLVRTRATASQSDLTAFLRRRNVAGAFSISPRMSRVDIEKSIRGRVIVLVDDVRTTGATLNACARVLKQAGAAEVRAVTVAIARPTMRDDVPRR